MKLWYEVDYLDIAIGKKYDEMNKLHFAPINKGGTRRKWYGNNEYVINWSNNGEELKNYKDENGNKLSYPRNLDYQMKEALTWGDICTGDFSMRYSPSGFFFSDVGNELFVPNELLMYALAFCNTNVFNTISKMINQTMHFKPGNMLSVPFIVDRNNKKIVENIAKININLAKKDWDSFENSWDFKCHPLISVIAQNRVLFDDTTDIDLAECYSCWKNECNERFNQLKANEEELNRIFIEIYGLQDELTPEVEDKDITVRKADLQRDIKSLVSYAVGCMFGRYSIYQEGLMYAGGMWDYSKYKDAAWRAEGRPDVSDFYTTLHYMPDFDNIIPITDEEYFTDDIVGLFEDFIKEVYGKDTLEKNLSFVAKALGNKGNTSREVIRNYFLNDFFKDHCNTYSVTGSGKRPIYWLFDSGKQNGFKALIYMHRYDADTVGRVRTDYLHKAQRYVETAMQSAQYTIDNATSASEKSRATKAVTKYTKQLAEMKIYDEAIAHVANQRIKIDLDDGVKVNYAKFQDVEVAQEGKKALKVDLLAKI